MRARTCLSVFLAFGLLSIAAAAAQAHSLVVARPGTAEIDLGTGERPTVVHATLDATDDTLDVRLRPERGQATTVELLVPDVAAEARASDADLPTAVVRVGDGASRPVPSVDAKQVRDDVTGVAYRRIARLRGVEAEGADLRVHVARGDAPTRVAVRVTSADAPFEARGAERTPRTVMSLRAWYDTAPASAPARPAAERRRDERLVWVPAFLAVAMLGVAAWWMARGRSRARTRGIERSNSDR